MTVTPMAEWLTQLSSVVGGLVVAYTMFQNYFPREITRPLKYYFKKLINFFYPYIHITFPEFEGDGFQRSLAYAAIKRYLNAHSSSQAKHLQASVARDTEAVVLTMASNSSEEVHDDFRGVKLWWASRETPPATQTISWGPREADKRFFSLTFHRKHRQLICDVYIKHVLDQGKAITVKERRRKLFTNSKGSDGGGYYHGRRRLWSEVVFDHPATFQTLAMDPVKKEEIIDDLINFSESKDYYRSVGKAWKRGYLLYGPPGTGKSTMIAAMANLLEYDVYDLELTAVKDNTELRKLLIDTSGKSIIVIEDIDCSLELTGQREKKEKEEEKKEGEEKDAVKEKMKKMMEEKKTSEVTLSGLLNFIDGLWSACGGERIIVFTTNYVEKLDPALIRRGRMDQHIELSYCGYEAFKVLAKNYLQFEEHELFGRIRRLLEETKMTPADVAENLMPKLRGEDKERCLMRLVKAIEEAKVKAEEEEKLKAEEEEKKKKKAAAEDEEEKKKKAAEEENGVKENGDAGSTNGVVKENGVKENGA
ncbi:AAA-ATPase At3g28580-like isoform X3 [Salvia hispanica]|uniref:AAA-ATPase At3g28580-like isoform X2 n=1 Tax=Salvia hispanica TaxID=49212 RepID=UPI0020093314|nr:AAA-ATPase At3g28580-like isoform X2 [Salvia hispanica]XP_047970611.1 AAA-ATPase At3g28580-like isoform X3 [Salvia hispanica]